MYRIGILVAVAAILAGCGGSSSKSSDARVLHLRSGDYTESVLLTKIRASDISVERCQSLKGLDAKAVRSIIEEGSVNGGQTQTANEDDMIRYAELIIQECVRIK